MAKSQPQPPGDEAGPLVLELQQAGVEVDPTWNVVQLRTIADRVREQQAIEQAQQPAPEQD